MDIVKTIIGYLPHYLLPTLLCLLWLIKAWRIENGGIAGLQEAIPRMAAWSAAWPLVILLTMLSWRIFAWEFWLQPVRLPAVPPLDIKAPWWRK